MSAPKVKRCPSCGHLMGSDYVTTTQAGKLVGLSAATVLRACQAKKIPARRSPVGHYRILTGHLHKLIWRKP